MGNKREVRSIIVGIYKITNKKNGHAYIGQAVNIHKRWNKHKASSFNPNAREYDAPICCAIRKYGVDNFTFEIIEECSIVDLNQREIFWIDYYDTYNSGYNRTLGGDAGNKGPDERTFGIINDLENTQLTHQQIADKWGMSKRTVDDINTGRVWRQDGKNYPLQTYVAPKGEQNYCVQCGKEVSYGATYCKECYLKERSKNTTAKEELLYLILRYPFTQIGEMFNVDGNAVRKWCKKYELPYKQADIQKLREELSITEWHIKMPERFARCNVKKVAKYDLDGNLIKEYESISDAGRDIIEKGKYKSNFETARTKIAACCHDRRVTAYGYVWKFV